MLQAQPPGFWGTVKLLLIATRRKAKGRSKRQAELLRHRTGKKASSTDWSWLGLIMSIVLTAILNSLAAYLVYEVVVISKNVELNHQKEIQGKIIVEQEFIDAINRIPSDHVTEYMEKNGKWLEEWYDYEARHLVRVQGGSSENIKKKLRESVQAHGGGDFVPEKNASYRLKDLPRSNSLAAMLGSIVLLLWCLMMVCQGEGLELDLQRRRHPMWEWLLSHPVTARAVFTAEMLAPIAANPIYCTAPLFAGILYGLIYGTNMGIFAGVIIGIPMAVALAFLGKALEIAITLRLPVRSRGAMIGLMSWFGYVSMMFFFIGGAYGDKATSVISKLPEPHLISWPLLGLFLGQSGNSFSFFKGIFFCLSISVLIIAASIWFSAWSANKGLSGNFGKADAAPKPARKANFGKRPLYRKEFLWFVRDRSAIVQAILIPLTISAFQMFNMRGLVAEADGAWNYLCGLAILFGTYFLWVLGPKSLGSEGSALWISLTWPHGLEKLLKAKAWLWSIISSAIVGLILLYAIIRFPEDGWKIILVGIGWYFFGRSMAEKSVTLVRITSDSGEQQKIPRNRQWAASLGMLTFAIGILTQQWHIAIMGIVYSFITAAAMWQNFRARLPYLYDQWSEEFPKPPTLMHAMIAISILVEVGAVISSIGLVIGGRENIAVIQTVVYACCAVAVSLGMVNFLHNRDVETKEIWNWENPNTTRPSQATAFMIAAAAGLGLGLFAVAYKAALLYIPEAAEILHKSEATMQKIPGLHLSYAIMAIGFAPFAEEYLFRGLLFRALDKEWGGWPAILGSAAFFAIYHPPLAWIPVGLLGIANAYIFKRTGLLAPAVLLHMIYNAVVVSFN